jgi:hypothetical protein
MKNRSSVRSVRALAPAESLFLIGLLIPGSVALSQPFPSFMLDSTVTYMPGFDDVNGTRAAFGPDLGLVVWNSRGVRGVRIGRSSGVPLDSLQIEISGPDIGSGSRNPGVAWSGHNFLVAWAGYHAAACALVEPDGRVTSRAVFQESVVDGRGAAVAFDGSNFLVTWIAAGESLGLTAYFCRVSPQGAVLDSPPRLVAPLAAGRQISIALCFYGGRYLATWNDWDTIGVSGNFILPDGSIADSAGFPIRQGVATDCPAVTHDRHNFIVSWNETGYRTKTARVTNEGAVLDTGGILIDSLSADQTAVVSNGDTTLVLFRRDSVWADPDSTILMAVRMDAEMNRLDAVPIRLSAAGYDGWGDCPYNPAAALCGQDYFIVWGQLLVLGEYAEDNAQALCRRMDRNGQLLDSAPKVLSYGTSVQTSPDLASDGTDFLAAWNEMRRDSTSPIYSIYCSRFSADEPLGSPIRLGNSAYEFPPSVAFGGGCYLVAWYDSGEIMAKRITPTGLVLDSLPLQMPEPDGISTFPDVAFGDSAFLVAWASYGRSPDRCLEPTPAIHGCRVTPEGTVLDATPLPLAIRPVPRPLFPRIAFDGVNFLVARRDGDDVHRCTRVGTNGALLDTADITLGAAGPNYDYASPEVAHGSGVFFVVDNSNARAWRVSPAGYLLDSVSHSYTGATHVAFDGTDFMLICQSVDNSGELAHHLGAIRVTPTGRVLDSVPFTLVTSDGGATSWAAAMSTSASNRVGLVFACHEPAPYLASRLRAATFPAIVGIGSQREVGQPVAFSVQPNPASRLASLSFDLTQAGMVRVAAFDAAGRRCANLFSGLMKAGRQTLPLDTRRLANGVYFLRLEAEAATHSTRLVVAR